MCSSDLGEPGEERDAQGLPNRYPSGLERLNCVRDFVTAGRARRCKRSERDVRVHRCDDATMRAGTLGAVGGAGAAALWSAPAPAPFVPVLARTLGIRTRLDGGRGVAITFDDGPHPEGTPAVLAELERLGVTATFFLTGEQVERFPSVAAAIAGAGHKIGLHGYRHRLLLLRGPRAVDQDLDRAFAAVEDSTAASPVWFRPPYGVFSLASLALVRRRGWKPLLWSQWGCDWRARETPASIARRATASLSAGDVVLLHDADHYSSAGSWRRTVAALPAIVDAALALGEPLVSVTHST